MKRRRRDAGLTLIEVLIAVTLLSLLTVGMAIAMRVGLNAYAKASSTLMDDRKVAGAQRVLESELEGLMPVLAPCMQGKGTPGPPIMVFAGEQDHLRLVSTFSLQQGWRGQPQLLDLFVIPGEDGHGVRLVVNETPYSSFAAGQTCMGIVPDGMYHTQVAQFAPPTANQHSFVLADKLAYCRFAYLAKLPDEPPIAPALWRAHGSGLGWPKAIRVEMEPLTADASRLQPLTIIAPIRVHRAPEIQYGDF